MFYSSFAQSLITYGHLVYGNDAKHNSMKINRVFELYILEVLKELWKKLPRETLLNVLQSNEPPKQRSISRWASKGHFRPTYNGTVASRKALSNPLQKAINWLTEMKTLPSNLKDLSQLQVKKLISEISSI